MPGLGVELANERVLLGKTRAQPLQIVLGGSTRVSPETQGLVPDKLDSANGLLDGSELLWRPVYFILVGQHNSRVYLPVFITFPSLLFLSWKGGKVYLAWAQKKQWQFISRV